MYGFSFSSYLRWYCLSSILNTKNHKGREQPSIFSSKKSKTKVYGLRPNLWAWDWPLKRAWSLVKVEMKSRFYNQSWRKGHKRQKMALKSVL